jgi:hypothetical protein
MTSVRNKKRDKRFNIRRRLLRERRKIEAAMFVKYRMRGFNDRMAREWAHVDARGRVPLRKPKPVPPATINDVPCGNTDPTTITMQLYYDSGALQKLMVLLPIVKMSLAHHE